MFCPFVNKECVSNCMFRGEKNSCVLANNIAKIASNTGTDQTYSSYINSKLEDISKNLEVIVNKM